MLSGITEWLSPHSEEPGALYEKGKKRTPVHMILEVN